MTERAKRAAGRIYRSIQGENQPPFAQIIAEEYADLEAEVEAFHRPIWKGVALPVRGPTPSEMLKRIAELEAEMAELNLGEELDTKRIKTLEAENARLRDALVWIRDWANEFDHEGLLSEILVVLDAD